MAVARPAVFCVAFATLPSVLQDLLGGGAGCRGAALTPALVIPLVASLRGAVRSAGHTGAGSGLRYGLDTPRQTEAGSTVGRTRHPVGRGRTCRISPDTPRLVRSPSPFACEGTRNAEFTGNVTPCVTPPRYPLRHPPGLRIGASPSPPEKQPRQIRRPIN